MVGTYLPTFSQNLTTSCGWVAVPLNQYNLYHVNVWQDSPSTKPFIIHDNFSSFKNLIFHNLKIQINSLKIRKTNLNFFKDIINITFRLKI